MGSGANFTILYHKRSSSPLQQQWSLDPTFMDIKGELYTACFVVYSQEEEEKEKEKEEEEEEEGND